MASGLVAVGVMGVKIFAGLAEPPYWCCVGGWCTGEVLFRCLVTDVATHGGVGQVSVSTAHYSWDHLLHPSRSSGELGYQAPAGDRGMEAGIACANPRIPSDPPCRT